MPRRKQRRSWGCVTEVARGKKYVLRWQDPSKKCGRATETVHGTYREACNRLDAIHAEKMAEGYTRPYTTIGDVYERFVLPDYRKRLEMGKVKARSLEMYEAAWHRDASPRWADADVNAVKAIDVQNWLMTLTKSRANLAMTVLKKAGDFAVSYEIAGRNVFRAKYLMPANVNEHSKRVYDEAEARRILSIVEGTRIEAPYILMAFGSCRTGESLGFRASEIERYESAGRVFAAAKVERRMEQTGSLPMPDGDLKTAESRRVVVVPPPYGERLLAIAERKRAEGIEWLCDRGDGLPMDKNAAAQAWRAAVPEEDRVPMQNLRASWRTMAAMEWGVSSDLLEILMGHRLPGVTGRHYLRPSDEQIIERFAAEFLSKNRGT